MSEGKVLCTRCGRSFSPQFRYQRIETHAGAEFYCSQTCRHPGIAGGDVQCGVCQTSFKPTLARHVHQDRSSSTYLCSDACRQRLLMQDAPEETRALARCIAVLNQKGGTGKTTTALSAAAGLASAGHKTLLMDFDPQGNIGVSLGINSPRSIYHILFRGVGLDVATVPVRDNLDVVTAGPSLAAAEIELARVREADRAFFLSKALPAIYDYEYVIFDCAPALSILNHNALVFCGEVLIPVSCDYLALVGVKQVLRTLRRITEQTGKPMRLAGVLPTFYDARKRVCVDALNHMRETFGARTLPPVRGNSKLAEAPSRKKTIFEHAPDSHGARDYMRVVQWLRNSEQTGMTRAA